MALPLAKGRCGTASCSRRALLIGLHTARPNRRSTGPPRPRPDPGPFTRTMGLPSVQLQLGLLWALVWAQVAGSACPSCGGPALAPHAERALVLKLAKQQILEGLQLTSRPRMTHPPPQALLTRALRRLQRGRVAPASGEQVISFAVLTGG